MYINRIKNEATDKKNALLKVETKNVMLLSALEFSGFIPMLSFH